MRKLLLATTILTLTAATAQARDNDYYEQTCEQYERQDRDMEIWCVSYRKHKRDEQSTKNDKGHIDDLMREQSRFDDRRDAPPPPPPGHYDDWANHQPGAYGNYQPASRY